VSVRWIRLKVDILVVSVNSTGERRPRILSEGTVVTVVREVLERGLVEVTAGSSSYFIEKKRLNIHGEFVVGGLGSQATDIETVNLIPGAPRPRRTCLKAG
jgi:hypothetical protein